MAETACGFTWYELMTTDPAGAAAFYGKVVGWQAQKAPMAPPDKPYTLLGPAGQMPTAGLMALPEPARAMGAPPHWLGYVGVPDVDAWVAKAEKLGAQVLCPAMEVPGMVRFACLRDPEGAVFGLLTPLGQPECARPDCTSPGRVAWHELYATDWEKAFAFYAALFGWEKDEAMDMGPMGIYQIYKSGQTRLGGMMTRPPGLPVPVWQYYISVPDIDAALDTIKAEGGTVMFGPQQVPGGAWIINAKDPQGAAFAVVGMRKE
jgi:predicted enzyme related to lactoylglutathione lyase